MNKDKSLVIRISLLCSEEGQTTLQRTLRQLEAQGLLELSDFSVEAVSGLFAEPCAPSFAQVSDVEIDTAPWEEQPGVQGAAATQQLGAQLEMSESQTSESQISDGVRSGRASELPATSVDVEALPKRTSRQLLRLRSSGAASAAAGRSQAVQAEHFGLPLDLELGGNITPAFVAQDRLKRVLYLDASSLGNPGSGGAAVSDLLRTYAWPLGELTSPRAELLSLLGALRLVAGGHFGAMSSLRMCSDSRLICDGFNTWLSSWIQPGGKIDKGKVMHTDIWRLVDEQRELLRRAGVTASVQWVPGHANVAGNIYVDHEARNAARVSRVGTVSCLDAPESLSAALMR